MFAPNLDAVVLVAAAVVFFVVNSGKAVVF